jgi:hypothetical protein
MRRNKLFISYSHQDKILFDEFRCHLGYWSEEGQIQVWSDEILKASERWREEIDKALDSAAVAVLLISSDFLNSKFIRDVELPALLGAREDGLLLSLRISHRLFTRVVLGHASLIFHIDHSGGTVLKGRRM